MTNLWKDLPVGDNPPDEVNLVIEIPKGSRNKIELQKETGVVKLDRVLHKPFRYKWNYGLIPRTFYEDGDAADGILIMSEPMPAGSVVSVRPIGLIRMIDSGEVDDKIISVAVDDPDFKNIRGIEDLPKKALDEIRTFFSKYKIPEGKKTEVKKFENSDAAKRFILKAAELYKKKFGGS